MADDAFQAFLSEVYDRRDSAKDMTLELKALASRPEMREYYACRYQAYAELIDWLREEIETGAKEMQKNLSGNPKGPVEVTAQ